MNTAVSQKWTSLSLRSCTRSRSCRVRDQYVWLVSIRRLSVLCLFVGLLTSVKMWANPFTAADMDVFMDDVVEGPKLKLSTDTGNFLLYADADAHWENSINHGNELELNLKDGDKKAALIRFDLSSVTGNVTSATLCIKITGTGGSHYATAYEFQPLKVYAVNSGEDDWNEYTVHRYNQPGSSPISLGTHENVEAGIVYRTDVLTQVTQALNDDQLVSFKLKTGDSYPEGQDMYMHSREDALMWFPYSGEAEWNTHAKHNMLNSKRFFLMALTCYYDADAVSAEGAHMKEELMKMLRVLLTPGNAPDAAGRLQWPHCPIIHSLTLVRHSDEIWDNMLTVAEREKVTLLVKAMTMAGNYCFEDDNNFTGNVALDGTTQKYWNPNHIEPYVGALIAGSLFFGSANQESLFADFNYDTYMADFAAKGLDNAFAAWNQTTAANMEATGTAHQIPEHGSGIGVNAPMTYSGVPATWIDEQYIPSYDVVTAGTSNPFGIYNNLAQRMFAWNVVDEAINHDTTPATIGRLYAGSPSSPYQGKLGMLFEYIARDGSGDRSSSSYAFDGWQNNIFSAATLIAFDCWGDQSEATKLAELETRMVNGSEDFRHKLAWGWDGYKNGSPESIQGFNNEHDLMFLLWDKFVKPNTLQVNDVTTTSNSTYLVAEGLQPGSKVWTDRTYMYTQVPEEVQGVTYIQTCKNDYFYTNLDFLSFNVNTPAMVYIAAYAYESQPDWLTSSWEDTGEYLVTSNGKPMQLYRRYFPAGNITLGANNAAGGNGTWMYTVAVKAAAPLIVTNVSADSSYPYTVYEGGMTAGGQVWHDRPYTYSVVPDIVAGQSCIRTAKDDYTKDNLNFLSFHVTAPVTVFVADPDCPPDWLSNSWTDVGEDVVTSNGKYMRLYRRDFPAGNIILGGNNAEGGCGTWMYTVVIAPQL